jgi:hypothetical protein
MKFVSLNMVERGQYDEDTGVEVETSKPVVINTATIRCFYARKDGKPGTRITFNDGGGFAVIDPPGAIAELVAGGDLATLPPPPPAPAAEVA